MHPRHLTSVLVGADERSVHVTWMLGDVVPAHPVEYFSYLVQITESRGNFVKQFGVKFVGTENPEVFAFVHNFMGGGQANYVPEQVTVTSESVSVHFVDASVGVEPVAAADAHLNVNGVDLQTRFPVTIVDAPEQRA